MQELELWFQWYKNSDKVPKKPHEHNLVSVPVAAAWSIKAKSIIKHPKQRALLIKGKSI